MSDYNSLATRDESTYGQNETEDIRLLPLPPVSFVSSRQDLVADWDVEAGPSGVDAANSAAETAEGTDVSFSSEEYSILVEAIRNLDAHAVENSLREGASLSRYDERTNNPLHVAIKTLTNSVQHGTLEENVRKKADAVKIVRQICMNALNKSDVLDRFNSDGYSPIALAIKSGDMDIIEALVSAGANLNYVTSTGNTAIHEAAYQNHNALKYFLDMDIKHDLHATRDVLGCAAIHYAAMAGSVESMKLLLDKFGETQLTFQCKLGWTAWHNIVSRNFINVAQFLFKTDMRNHGLNSVDGNGMTPLVLSTVDHYRDMAALFLRNGAILSVKGEQKSAIEHITKKFANPSQFLEEIFDDRIFEKNDKVHVNYDILVDKDNEGKSQINVLEELVRCGQSNLLKHPMIESLIYIKWTDILPVFYLILAIYVMFLGSLNAYVITALSDIQGNGTSNATGAETDTPYAKSCEWYYGWAVLIYVSVCFLLIQECVWTHLQGSHYLPSLKSCMTMRLKSCRKLRFEPCMKLCGFELACWVPLLLGCGGVAPAPWQRHVTCAALLLAWLQAMLLLSRFPGWGYYVLMFERVSINILKVFMTSVFLVIGFSVCFMVQFLSKPPFDGPFAAFMKTLVMMTSEFDYEGLFDENHDSELRDSRTFVRLLFMTFVIFVAIVLMNFMIGVSVSDINELVAIGDVRRLEKQVELLRILEGLGSTRLGKWWTRLSRIRYHRVMNRYVSLSATAKCWTVYPSESSSDSFQINLTTKLQHAILEIAKNKKHIVNKLDALYDAVVQKEALEANRSSENSTAPVKTLKDRIASLEASNKDIVNADKEIIKDLIELSI